MSVTKALAAALALATAAVAQTGWQSLFDGKSLAGWRETAFSAGGPARVEGGTLVIGPGKPLAGVTLTGEFPHIDYEVRFEAARREGSDFFASLTGCRRKAPSFRAGI